MEDLIEDTMMIIEVVDIEVDLQGEEIMIEAMEKEDRDLGLEIEELVVIAMLIETEDGVMLHLEEEKIVLKEALKGDTIIDKASLEVEVVRDILEISTSVQEQE